MDRLTAVVVFLGSFVGVLSGVLIVVRIHRRGEQLRRLWSVAAERLGGRLRSESRGILMSDDLGLTVRVNGVTVDLESHRGSWGLGRRSNQRTVVRATTSGTAGLEVVARARSRADARTSQDRGGEDLVVDASDEIFAEAWMAPPIRRAVASCPDYGFTLSAGVITATRRGVEDDVNRLLRVAKAVATFSSGGRMLLRAMRTMAAEVGGVLSARSDTWETDGGVLTIVDRLATQILIDNVRQAEGRSGLTRVYTRVRARPLMTSESHFVIHGHLSCEPPAELASLPLVSHDDPDFSQHYTLLTNDEMALAKRLSSALRQRIEVLRPALVTGDGREVTMLLPGVVLDARRVSEAMDLAIELSAPGSSTPYR